MALLTVACGPTAEHVPPDALTERDEHRAVATGEKVWVMDGGRSGGTNSSWHLQTQDHMSVVSTHFFNTDPCDGDESGCPFGYTGFLVSFDAKGDYDVHVIECEWNVSCAPEEAFDTFTYHITVT